MMTRAFRRSRIAVAILILCLAGAAMTSAAKAASREPWEAADALRDALFAAQAATLGGDAAAAVAHVAEAEAVAAEFDGLPGESAALLGEALAAAHSAAQAGDGDALAGARGLAQGAVYWGGYLAAREAVSQGDAATARQWLLVRDFRPSTRFSRPDADATLAVRALTAESLDDAIAQLDADLLDTYQARLSEHLAIAVDPAALPARRAESAGIAAAYWRAIAPAFAAQNANDQVPTTAFDSLLPALLAGDEAEVARTAGELGTVLDSFRAAPLSPDDLARRAGQLLRYLALVPIEYERGVQDNTVLVDLEVQEAVTFMRGAEAAYADMSLALNEIDGERAAALSDQIAATVSDLDAANRKERVLTPAEITANIEAINAGLAELLPAEWTEANADADFDVLASVLDQMEAAVRAGDYELAESARLEGYAIFDFGPEPRLLGFAPALVGEIDGLFWQGYDGRTGLAQAIALEAPSADIAAIRADLDAALEEAQLTLGDLSSAPGAVISNAAIIVFREGLESVVILAALMGSMVGVYARYRRPMVLGVLLSLAATAVTWWIAQQILSSLTRFGERLEAVVSLIAIGVLLLITNWFFHKSYWKDWMAGFHQQKRRILTAETGQFVGLVVLGFTSMYREGFETVLFLQALVLEAGTAVVLQGVAVGALAVLIVGFITFKLQARLPYKKMLVWTGVLIGVVLVTMVGKTVHVMQAVGWVGISPIQGFAPPYWAGLWFGVYATWQGVLTQIAAAVFVIGSYYLAEGLQGQRRKQIARPRAAQAKKGDSPDLAGGSVGNLPAGDS
jgi:high-affinity iron transporter